MVLWSRFKFLTNFCLSLLNGQKVLRGIFHSHCVSFLSSECDGCCCQCSVPDHAQCVSQKTTQTLQTAPQTHHGILDDSQRRSRSQVRDNFCPVFFFFSLFCSGMSHCAVKHYITAAFVFFAFAFLVRCWSFSRTRPPAASLRQSSSCPTSPFSVTSTRITSRVSWSTWPSTPSPTSPYRD